MSSPTAPHPPAPPGLPPLPWPMTIRHWTRGRRLGAGSYGTVFMYESFFRDKVAVKMAMKTVPDEVHCLEREIQNLKILDGSPYAPKYREDGETDLVRYLVEQYIDGVSLYHLLNCGVSLGEEFILTVARGLLRALADFKSRGLAHRDLKPDNILIKRGGTYEVVVIDFGLSGHPLYQDGIGGSLEYAPPEVFAQGFIDGSAYDAWSAGIVMVTYQSLTTLKNEPTYLHIIYQYEMATGERPFHLGPNPATWFWDLVEAELQLSTIPNIHLRDLAGRLLKKDWRQRIPVGTAALHPYFRAVPEYDPPPPPPPTPPARREKLRALRDDNIALRTRLADEAEEKQRLAARADQLQWDVDLLELRMKEGDERRAELARVLAAKEEEVTVLKRERDALRQKVRKALSSTYHINVTKQ
ncbi:Serine/threonine kinase [Rhizophlyctis rosea]|uniref:Serine/threonine kinase n=1 Tax=Rhizophlyctis rosea TaxID=64517 RepID=A0AAD5X6M4_9FUNG|nr:Serine/threonine kinase [Rhizophlyctis rosea]